MSKLNRKGLRRPIGPDLVGAGRLAGERVVGGDRVVLGGIGREVVAVDVDAQDLAEENESLAWLLVAAAAAVADGDVEVAIRAEGELAAIVIGGARMRDGEDVCSKVARAAAAA